MGEVIGVISNKCVTTQAFQRPLCVLSRRVCVCAATVPSGKALCMTCNTHCSDLCPVLKPKCFLLLCVLHSNSLLPTRSFPTFVSLNELRVKAACSVEKVVTNEAWSRGWIQHFHTAMLAVRGLFPTSHTRENVLSQATPWNANYCQFLMP